MTLYQYCPIISSGFFNHEEEAFGDWLHQVVSSNTDYSTVDEEGLQPQLEEGSTSVDPFLMGYCCHMDSDIHYCYFHLLLILVVEFITTVYTTTTTIHFTIELKK